MLLIEKCESTEETIKVLEKIINKVKDKDKDILIRILKLILNEKIGEQEVKRLVSKIEGGDGEMLAVIDMVRRENQMYINMGKKQTCIEIAKKLLSRNIPKEDIQEITGLKQKELDSISKEK